MIWLTCLVCFNFIGIIVTQDSSNHAAIPCESLNIPFTVSNQMRVCYLGESYRQQDVTGGNNFFENTWPIFNTRPVNDINSYSSRMNNFLPNSENTIPDVDIVDHRIMGGYTTSISEVPYLAAIIYENKFVCGGAIITKMFVLTAAHCTKGKDPNKMWLRVGSDSLRRGGFVHGVKRLISHEQFLSSDYDIGLIQVASPFIFRSTVMAVPLIKPEDFVGTSNLAVISGWGATLYSKGAPSYNEIRKVWLPLTTLQQCRRRKMLTSKPITPRQICTKSPVNVGTCYGDSGGPLVLNGKLAGITSWGSPCSIGDPDVFTNLQHFLPWIYKHITASDSSNYAELKHPITSFKYKY